MRRLALAAAAAACVVAAGPALLAQDAPKPETYGDTPEPLAPYHRAGEPARRFFTVAPEFRGPGREDPVPADLAAVRVGVIAPLTGPDARAGERMIRGVRMALDEANAAGGWGARKVPFEAVVIDEGLRWGQAGDGIVSLVTDHDAVALVGAYEDANTHVMTRVVLKSQITIVNTAGVDPTLTEHMIPWVLRVRADDRQVSYRLVRKVFEEDRRTRVVMFRANDRYGRTGTREFVDAARRLGHPVPLEVRYEAGDADFAARLERIRAARPDAIVVWGRAGPTGAAVRALRLAGIDAPVYAPDRVADDAFVEAAGSASEGVVFAYPMDPRKGGAGWAGFRERWRARWNEEPDATAAFAYDGARMIVEAVRKAGPNRWRVRDALFAPRTFDGVTGTIRFDATQNARNVPVLGRVEKARFVFGE